MIESIGLHALQNSDVIHNRRKVRQKLTQLRSVLTVFCKLELRAQQLGVWIDERCPIPFQQIRWRECSIELRQLRLVVEHLQMRWRTGHKQVNYALGLSCMMRLLRS